MTTLNFVDKEDGEPGTHVATEDGLKLGSRPSVKAVGGRSQFSILYVGKTFAALPAKLA